MTTGRMLRPLKSRGGYPERVLGFDTETHAEDPTADEQVQRLTLGYTCYWEKGTERGDSQVFTTIGTFWDRVEELARPCAGARFGLHGPDMLYVVAHNAGFDVMVLDAEGELERRGWSVVGDTAMFPKPFFLELEKKGKRFCIMDLGNLWGQVPLAKIGTALRFPKGEPGGCGTCGRCRRGQAVVCDVYRPDHGCEPGTVAWDDLSTYCRRDTEIVVQAMREWVTFCEENECGPFRRTAAGQALACWRSNFLEEGRVYLHRNPSVIKLERDSYSGGLTDVWRRGRYEGETFVKLDVNSMHPSQMATQLYPCKLVRYVSSMSLERFSEEGRLAVLNRALDEGYAVVSRVTIETPDEDRRWAAAPFKMDGKLVYPVGTFESVLTTRELRRCLKLGIVKTVAEFAVYEMRDLFSGYVEHFNALKVRYGREGNDAFKSISKSFLNNLYGKFGQLNDVPLELEEEARGRVIAGLRGDGVNAKVVERRGENGELVQRWSMKRFLDHIEVREGRVEEGPNSFCAIASHIVADSRVSLLEFREIAGSDHVYYGDTDSLVTDEQGAAHLEKAGVVDDFRLGYLKVEERASVVEFWAPKDYRFGETVKRKGIRLRTADVVGYAVGRASNGEWLNRSMEEFDGGHPIYRQAHFRTLSGALRAGDAGRAVISMVEKMAAGTYTKGMVDEDGWVKPWNIRK